MLSEFDRTTRVLQSQNINIMKRWTGLALYLTMIGILTSFGTYSLMQKATYTVPEALKVTSPVHSVVHYTPRTVANNTLFASPFLRRNYLGFKEALAFKESRGRYTAVNSFGYLGKYQFGINTLRLVGVYDPYNFLYNPALQEKAFEANIARNKWILRKYIKRFIGKSMRGTTITESGLLAAAHLAGAGNVKKYLRSYGRKDVADAYGSSISYYIRKFAGYDTTSIPQKRNAKIEERSVSQR